MISKRHTWYSHSHSLLIAHWCHLCHYQFKFPTPHKIFIQPPIQLSQTTPSIFQGTTIIKFTIEPEVALIDSFQQTHCVQWIHAQELKTISITKACQSLQLIQNPTHQELITKTAKKGRKLQLKFWTNHNNSQERKKIGVCIGRVGLGWGNFLIQSTMVGKKKIQFNPTQPNSHGLDWTHEFDKFSLLLLLYWVKKYININILKKPKD